MCKDQGYLVGVLPLPGSLGFFAVYEKRRSGECRGGAPCPPMLMPLNRAGRHRGTSPTEMLPQNPLLLRWFDLRADAAINQNGGAADKEALAAEEKDNQ